MAQATASTPNLLSALLSVRSTPPRLILSPPTQPRRASVALIIRLKPPPDLEIPENERGNGLPIEEFFQLPWVSHPLTTPELLYIRRKSRPADRYSSHIAFPGGRQEQTDATALYTAQRETWEEIGVDLAEEKDWRLVGRLDDREITTSLGKRLLMILSPFVFLQTSPYTPEPELQASEVASLHWIPIPLLIPPFSPTQWTQIEIDISSRLSPRNRLVRIILRGLVGSMKFGAVLLPDEPDHVARGVDVAEFDTLDEGAGSWYHPEEKRRVLRLWGLSLGMTLDLMSHLPTPDSSPLVRPAQLMSPNPLASPSTSTAPGFEIAPGRALEPRTPVTVASSFETHINTQTQAAVKSSTKSKAPAATQRRGVGPGLTSVFPRFSYPDVNFWIWVFGRRYRAVIRGWEASLKGPSKASDRRTNWSGAALATFYSAVRQALVVAIIIRALVSGAVGVGLGWWLLKRWRGT